MSRQIDRWVRGMRDDMVALRQQLRNRLGRYGHSRISTGHDSVPCRHASRPYPAPRFSVVRKPEHDMITEVATTSCGASTALYGG